MATLHLRRARSHAGRYLSSSLEGIASIPAPHAMTTDDLLARVPLFRSLDADALHRLAAATRPVSFPAETRIVEIGEAGHSLFILLSGEVRVLYPARSADYELARLGPGEVFGEMALLNDMPRSATVQAVGDVELLVLEKDDFRKVIEESPAVALKLLEVLSLRIRSADEHISGLSDKAMRDALTGLLNRRAFHERIKEEVDRSLRYGDTFALILLDLDHFKSINDTLGHDTGDAILSWLGRLLIDHTRSADAPFRVGGEEFAILAPATSADVAANVAQRLVETVAEARPPVGHELRVTMSGGFAACPDHGAAPDVLYTVADRALLRAKENGRNRIAEPRVDT
ncbi:MAG: GGDEF domain-containing protein [Gemmatimonadetes bacterium]|nr:MAG: GGDEF domain-containing protein [Gemmatimonadota bacterium]